MDLAFQGWKFLHLGVLRSVPSHPPRLMCPKAHSPTTFRLQETLRTPHRGGVRYSQDATRNAGHWDTARTVLRKDVCMLIPRSRRQVEHAAPRRGQARGRGVGGGEHGLETLLGFLGKEWVTNHKVGKCKQV